MCLDDFQDFRNHMQGTLSIGLNTKVMIQSWIVDNVVILKL